jgi:hypothetical protein
MRASGLVMSNESHVDRDPDGRLLRTPALPMCAMQGAKRQEAIPIA